MKGKVRDCRASRHKYQIEFYVYTYKALPTFDDNKGTGYNNEVWRETPRKILLAPKRAGGRMRWPCKDAAALKKCPIDFWAWHSCVYWDSVRTDITLHYRCVVYWATRRVFICHCTAETVSLSKERIVIAMITTNVYANICEMHVAFQIFSHLCIHIFPSIYIYLTILF